MWCSRIALAVVVALAAACADEDRPEPYRPFEGYLTVWNRNSVSPEEPSFFELLELYVHATRDSRGSSLLSTPLAIDATVAVPFTSDQYVTVVRRRNTGQNIALTTGTPLTIADSCTVLEVFDEAFRHQRNDSVALDALQTAGFPSSCSADRFDGGPGGGSADGGVLPGDPDAGDPTGGD